MKEVDAGRLNRLVTIRSRGTNLNSLGEPDHTVFSDVITTWAEKSTVRTVERFVDSSDKPFQVVTFRMRYRTGLDIDMVLEHEGYRYDIEGLVPMGQRRRKYIMVTAVRGEKTDSVGGFLLIGDGTSKLFIGDAASYLNLN
jgi:head-tail adaptor